MEIAVKWWQVLIFVASGMGVSLISVLVGGWLVFRDKTITMPAQFFQPAKKTKPGSSNYIPRTLSEFDSEAAQGEEISSAAARLRAQKMDPPRDDKDKIMAFVRGGK
jgi:hypothetical protein